MSSHFPKSSRLRKSKEFIFIQRQGKKISGACIQFLVFRCQYQTQVRMGLTVSSKYGPSVARNLFKRRNRDLYRRLLSTIPDSWMIHIRPHGKVKHAKEVASYEALAKDWDQLLKQIQIGSENTSSASAATQAILQAKEKQDDGSRNAAPGTQ